MDTIVDTAAVVVTPEGVVIDATPAALELIGVTIDELKAAPRGAFAARPIDPSEQAALREQWEQAGTPEIGGETTIRRADGVDVRVRYVVGRRADGMFGVVLRRAEARPNAPDTMFGLGDVLTAWRAAERRLETITADSPEWSSVQQEITRLRETYQNLFEARRQSA